MSILMCKSCGGMVDVPQDYTFGECPHCGMQTTFPRTNVEGKEQLYNTAERYRQQKDFAKAANAYYELIKLDRSDADAYWGFALSHFGVTYQEDAETKSWVPSISGLEFNSFRLEAMTSFLAPTPVYYQKTLQHTVDAALWNHYEAEALRIAQSQQESLRALLDEIEDAGLQEKDFLADSLSSSNPDLLQLPRMLYAGAWSMVLNECGAALNANPRNAYAYLFRFMAEYKISQLDGLVYLGKPQSSGDTGPIDEFALEKMDLASQTDIKQVFQFGDEVLKKHLLYYVIKNKLYLNGACLRKEEQCQEEEREDELFWKQQAEINHQHQKTVKAMNDEIDRQGECLRDVSAKIVDCGKRLDGKIKGIRSIMGGLFLVIVMVCIYSVVKDNPILCGLCFFGGLTFLLPLVMLSPEWQSISLLNELKSYLEEGDAIYAKLDQIRFPDGQEAQSSASTPPQQGLTSPAFSTFASASAVPVAIPVDTPVAGNVPARNSSASFGEADRQNLMQPGAVDLSETNEGDEDNDNEEEEKEPTRTTGKARSWAEFERSLKMGDFNAAIKDINQIYRLLYKLIKGPKGIMRVRAYGHAKTMLDSKWRGYLSDNEEYDLERREGLELFEAAGKMVTLSRNIKDVTDALFLRMHALNEAYLRQGGTNKNERSND